MWDLWEHAAYSSVVIKKKNPYSYELLSHSVPLWLLTHLSQILVCDHTPHNVLLCEPMKISYPAAHQVDPWMNILHKSWAESTVCIKIPSFLGQAGDVTVPHNVPQAMHRISMFQTWPWHSTWLQDCMMAQVCETSMWMPRIYILNWLQLL